MDICGLRTCSANLLDLKEDTERKGLVLACPTCPYQAKEEKIVLMKYERNQDRKSLRDSYEDPTLPRAKDVSCPVCGHQKVELYVANTEGRMVPVYACCNPKCGDDNGSNDDQDRD